ncbi:sigma factor [Saccharibacillus kuerlensis]|uniref:sigma factor n=1 Tax=Saccharibacillus kuerlensis TaxID=459527 RepID=UPI000A0706F8|nr:sigma factor [Saccharibacillus kuerlensis]
MEVSVLYDGQPPFGRRSTQETFVKALRSLTKFRREASIKTWLLRIARNTFKV